MELPIWMCGQQLWVKGVDTKTTCSDIITGLLGHPDDSYVITERWRDVEKPLRGEQRLWELWSLWGEAQNQVRLTLKKASHNQSGGVKRYRVRAKGHHHIEKLLRLILAQGETIQTQLRQLHDREVQIEAIEEEKHKARVDLLGPNYVLEAYLGKTLDEKETDSGVITASDNTSPTGDAHDEGKEMNEISKQIELFEKIIKLNKRLEKEEETLVRLYINLRRDAEREENSLARELKKAEEEGERKEEELKENEWRLSTSEAWIKERKILLERLESELCSTEHETSRLMRLTQALYTSQIPSNYTVAYSLDL